MTVTSATPKSMRLHIGIFGRRNVGKSSVLNALCGQQISIVSPHAGTTTDPVEKPMELLPLGPVVFIDTAGIDDSGSLGELRSRKTRSCLDRVDLGVIITCDGIWGKFEQELAAETARRFGLRHTAVELPAGEAEEAAGEWLAALDQPSMDGLNVFVISRAVRQQLPLEDVDTDALLRGMLGTYPEFQPSKAQIQIEGRLPVVLGNEGGLTQCFSNLLGNAVKFVKPGQVPETPVRPHPVPARPASGRPRRDARVPAEER